MQYSAGEYDVVVVGAGHAGCEAGLAAARLGCKTLVLTINMDNVALMPCNPAMGGPAKGQLIREVDALGGEIGINTDRSAIQMRMLNTAKGPAVHALRAQADKKYYQENMKWVMENQSHLDLKQAIVDRILVKNNRVIGLVTDTGAVFNARSIILTTGTYLKGRIIIGELAYSGGPAGNKPSQKLSDSLTNDLGIKLMRFKTGTPARVDRRSIDFSKMTIQPGDERIWNFSYNSVIKEREQVPCWLTYTNLETHGIIKENMHRSPLYSGIIEGTGPRYCPSIEDKVVRFADRDGHQVFIEPEGVRTNEMYVQGLSTSLPEEVQRKMYRSVKGLEKVELVRPAYAIEYDCVDPTQLKLSLEFKELSGLFSAGQVNGTSGYEEAAAQGIIAGINAAMHVKNLEPLVLTRAQAYIGVLIDDLITKGTIEPYRMLTSRAEYRLLLRHDNADERLTEVGFKVGLIDSKRMKFFENKRQMIAGEKERLSKTRITVSEDIKRVLDKKGVAVKKGTDLASLLKRPEFKYKDLYELSQEMPELPEDVVEAVEIELKYQGYISKQQAQVERFEKIENKKLPSGFDYLSMQGLSREAAQRLDKVRPMSLGQAARISGVNPSDITVLLIHLEKATRSVREEENID